MPYIDPKTSNGLSGVTVPDMSSFTTLLSKQLSKSAGIGKFEIIKLGNPAASSSLDLLHVPSNPSYVYYTTDGDEGAGIGMISAKIFPKAQLAPNNTFLILRVGSYVSCLSAAGIADEIFAESSGLSNPDQSPVTTAQLDFATLQPLVGTMYAVVKGAIYGDIGVADLQTADMSSSPNDTLSNPINIPTTANKAIGVLVQLDPATATLSYKQSSEFASSMPLAAAYLADLLPLRDEGLYRVGYIKLANGVESLDNGNVWPCPEFFPNIPTANELVFDAPSELTVASGAITATQSWHTVDTESNDPTDELDTINGLEAGRFYYFQAADASRIVKFKHGTGNILSGSVSDVDCTLAGIWVLYDGTKVNLFTPSNPKDVDEWGSWPDNSIKFGAQDTSSGELYGINGDEMQIWRTYQISGAVSFDAVPNMHLLFDSSTAFQIGINASTPAAGFAWEIQVLTAPGAGNHTLKLPAGCTFDGTNNTASFNATSDYLEGKWISSTRFLIKNNDSVVLSTT